MKKSAALWICGISNAMTENWLSYVSNCLNFRVPEQTAMFKIALILDEYPFRKFELSKA